MRDVARRRDPPRVPDINARIAGRLKALRAARRISLEALAAHSNVSRSMISLIERVEASPTAVVLEKLAAGLGVSLATLFEDPGPVPEPVSRRRQRSVWRDPASGYERCNVSPPGFPSPIQIVEVMLPAGAHVAYDSGPRTGAIHEQVWVRDGSIEVEVGGAVYRLARDDCLAFELDRPTAFRNPTSRRARYVVVTAQAQPNR